MRIMLPKVFYQLIWIYSINKDESQTNVDECRRVTRRVQMSVDECRRTKKFFFDSRKSDTWSHFAVVAIVQE